MIHERSSSMPAPSTNRRGDEVSSIARATTITLLDRGAPRSPTSEGISVYEGAVMIKAEMPHRSLAPPERSSVNIEAQVYGPQTCLAPRPSPSRSTGRGWITCRVGFSTAWRREVTPS